ncbi:MAG: response regulator transcription factor [Rhodospirillales bacterium]|nr:response regulator transcription factor [Rhodospirillales bacterium]
MTAEPNVHVIEDDETNRELMRDLFESVDLNVILYSSGDLFLEAMPVNGPGCILLDVRMPGISGLDLQSIVAKESRDLPIIIVTAHGDTQMAVRAMKEGAFDFIEKPINNQVLLDTVNKALAESLKLGSSIKEQADIQGRIDLLTPREDDVLQMIAQGKLNKQIAFELGITQRTVEVHRARVMEKMEAKTVADLLRTVMSLDAFSGKP